MGSAPATKKKHIASSRHLPACFPSMYACDAVTNNAKFQPNMNASTWLDTATYLAWRLASYVLLNLGEDAALVALMFC